MEGLACRLIGERALDLRVFRPLHDILKEQHEVLYGPEWNRQRALLWQDLNLDFHLALLGLADNPWLTEAVKRARLLPVVYSSRRRAHDAEAQVLLFKRHDSQQAYSEHVRILQALERNEATRAEGLMREHVLTNRDVLVRALSAEDEEAAAGADLVQAREM